MPPLRHLGISEQRQPPRASKLLEHGLVPIIVIHDLLCTLELKVLQLAYMIPFDQPSKEAKRGKENK